jgi:hypothetical protein
LVGVKPSTVVELAGFVCLVLGAWMLAPVAGVFVAGVSLLFIGYATSDDAAEVAVKRVIDPLIARRAARKVARASKRAAKAAVRKGSVVGG